MKCANCTDTLARHPDHRACTARRCRGCGEVMREDQLRRCPDPILQFTLYSSLELGARCVPGPVCGCPCFVAETVEVLA